MNYFRIAVLALAAGCSTTNSNFCTQSAIVPHSKFGTCNPSQFVYPLTDAGLVITAFLDVAACESANAASCTDQDRSTISKNISCQNSAISSLQNCVAGQELTWPGNWISQQCSNNGAPSAACSQAVGLTSP
jgi:hypothetical protein